MHAHSKVTDQIVCTCTLIGIYVALRTVNTSTPCEAFIHHTEGRCLKGLVWMLCAGSLSYLICLSHHLICPSQKYKY